MKKIITLMVIVVLIGVTLFAQGVVSKSVVKQGVMGYNGDHDQDGIANNVDQDFIRKFKPKWAQKVRLQEDKIKPFNKSCSSPNADGQGLGDGTKPKPRNGTGFGPQSGKRKGRNRFSKNTNINCRGKRLRDGSCRTDCIQGEPKRTRGNCHRSRQCKRRGKRMKRGNGQGHCRRQIITKVDELKPPQDKMLQTK